MSKQCLQEKQPSQTQGPGRKTPGHQRTWGRIYFSRETERTIFFYLTAAMLLVGLICRLI